MNIKASDIQSNKQYKQLMMSLLKWQAKILNKLFKTNAFEQIVIDNTNLQRIDYRKIYSIFNNQKLPSLQSSVKANVKVDVEEIIQSANKVCHGLVKPTTIRDEILKLNSLIESIRVNDGNMNEKKIEDVQIAKTEQSCLKYNIEHVIIYSSLSKCRIWPKMLKSSTTLVPSLIGFYNQFTKDFSYDLSYKFDPVILTHKYEKVMNKIEQKKKSFPQLFAAIQKNDWNLICQLIDSVDKNEKQPDFVNECKKQSTYISHHAVMYSSLEILKNLHNRYPLNFEKQDNEKQTAIFYAVKRNSLQIVKFLVQEAKVNINCKQYQDRTPIYLAAFEGNLQIVDYLYSRGANPQMESKLSRTPLSKACYLGNVNVADYLIKIGVNLTTIDSKGRTALHNAVWGIEGGRDGKKRGSVLLYDSPECTQLLLKAGHPVDIEDFDGFTPLFSAAASLAIRSMRVLINHGANLRHKTKRNESVVFVSAKYGHLQSLKILIQQFNCDYEECSIHQISPFDASMACDNYQVAHYLLDKYFDKSKKFTFQSLIKCLCYYKKEKNLQYLKLWAKDDKVKNDYIYDCLKHQIQTKQNFIADIFENQQDLLPCFLDFIQNQISKLDVQIVQFIVDRCVAAYKKGLLPNFPQFLWESQQILKLKQVQIKDLQVQSHTKEDDIIRLLMLETNITENHKSVHRLMLFLVKRRMTKVLLWILTLHDKMEQITNHKQKTGMYKFSKQQITQIVHYESQDQISIHNYCYIHGIHDAVKILQLEQTSIKIYIPKYEYSTEARQNHQPAGILHPVKEEFFYLEYLMKTHLNENQTVFYSQCLNQYDKRIGGMIERIQIVQSVEDMERMRQHFKQCRLIGVDIEHWNHSKEEFVCLVQVSAMGETFIIDALKVQKQHIISFLQQILSDENKIKVFHSFDMDLKWIGQDFYLQTFNSVVDTSKIFAILNPKNKSPSLRLLADLYLAQNINKDFQRSDWRIRPLFKEMIAYAGTDALVLPFLFIKQLMEANDFVKEKDGKFIQTVKKQFGTKRHIKGGRKNMLKLLQQ